MFKKLNILLLIFTFSTANFVFGDVKLAALFQSHMVLQQQENVMIWGWGKPGETVKIAPSWNKIITTQVLQDGSWKTNIQTLKSGGTFSIKVSDKDSSIELTDILFGEVWLCLGQSNMNFPLAKGTTWKSGVYDYEKVVAAANYPEIRYFDVERQTSPTILKDCKGLWQACTPQTAGKLSAVAYYFAVELQKELNVPIGIITTTWGGTAIESWTKQSVFETDPAFASILEKAKQDKPNIVDADSVNLNSRKYSYLYNAMIAPLIPFKIKGMLWYQGENNAKNADIYRQLFPAFINGLRADWNYDFPFYFVQLAPYKSSTPEIREAQFLTYKSVANTGMAVITDVGDSTDVHPRNKEVVGKRLSLWALAKTYGKKVEYAGPMYKSVLFKENKALLEFDFDKGLTSANDKLNEFTIAGVDKIFYPAEAVIKNNQVVVWSEKVAHPTAVRFGWKAAPQAQLFNAAKIPASSFRTDGPNKVK
ncbi:sialate O-acetylesterase [Pedobacter mucosus]|uniref:sialate O-acetylesterase n=1 Tax=Pedobacter mucosus TaxID=2895286 RepID=UPI001EE49D82|nr:sialate O-acetylesterase [Pedobacter mucosus]UKT64231.1 sialate O-acetylesterase [Pedobacter mucosus]